MLNVECCVRVPLVDLLVVFILCFLLCCFACTALHHYEFRTGNCAHLDGALVEHQIVTSWCVSPPLLFLWHPILPILNSLLHGTRTFRGPFDVSIILYELPQTPVVAASDVLLAAHNEQTARWNLEPRTFPRPSTRVPCRLDL